MFKRLFKRLFKRKYKEVIKVSHQIKGVSKVFVTLTRIEKLHFYFALLPSNFNLDEHINNYPPNECGFDSKLNFDKEKVKIILGSLSTVIAENKDLIVDDGYVPLNSTFLSNFMKDYNYYLEYLINTGVIDCNESYRASTPQLKGYSRGYRWTEQYANSIFERVWMDKAIDKDGNLKIKPRIHRQKSQVLTADVEADPTYSYLDYWYDQEKLHLDIDAALKYAELIRSKKLKLGVDEWDYNKDKKKKKHPHEQYKAILNNLYSLEINDYKVNIDDNVHRLHSVLTNMQKDFRNFINYGNQQLVSIDISNSQPYLACLLFNPEFWTENSSLPLNLYNLPNNIKQSLLHNYPNTNSIPIMLGKMFDKQGVKCFSEYIDIVASGQMYETIVKWVKKEKNIEIDRDKAKIAMFQILFSSNRDDRDDEFYWLVKYYREKFPTIMGVFKIIKRTFNNLDKERQYARLACLLQAIESQIILHRCCKKISQETGFKVPIFTIHDSIVTTIGNEEYVAQVMIKELSDCIGITPHLKFEYWSEKELDQELYEQIKGKTAIQEM